MVSAMPNGTVARPFATCDADEAVCPRCGNVIMGRLQPRTDSTLVTCRNVLPRSGGQPCNAHSLLVSAVGGLTLVVPLSAEEYQAARSDLRPIRVVLRELGVVTTRGVR